MSQFNALGFSEFSSEEVMFLLILSILVSDIHTREVGPCSYTRLSHTIIQQK